MFICIYYQAYYLKNAFYKFQKQILQLKKTKNTSIFSAKV